MRLAIIWRLAVLLLVVMVVYWWWRGSIGIGPEVNFEEVQVNFIQRDAGPGLSWLLIMVNDGRATVMKCGLGACREQVKPKRVSGDALTDGDSWYYLREIARESRRRGEDRKIVLLREDIISGKTEQIIEETSLTRPRELRLSNDGHFLSFWLDNIDEPDEALTELWAYRVKERDMRLLAEKLYEPDVRSKVRWNTAANYLWFLADVGDQEAKNDELELILVSGQKPGMKVAFKVVDWGRQIKDFDSLVMDISVTGEQLAYVIKGLWGRTKLIIVDENIKEITPVRGTVPYLQWLGDGSLLYAVQERLGFTWWRLSGGDKQLISSQRGLLRAAQIDDLGEQVAMAVNETGNTTRVYSLNIASGLMRIEGVVEGGGDTVKLVVVRQAESESDVAGIRALITELDDAEMAAFVENHIVDVVGIKEAKAVRLWITDEVNTVYVDYKLSEIKEERLLLKINDAAYTEWVIKGKYKNINNEWVPVEGGVRDDPAALRLYEWEEEVGRWILKSEY